MQYFVTYSGEDNISKSISFHSLSSDDSDSTVVLA